MPAAPRYRSFEQAPWQQHATGRRRKNHPVAHVGDGWPGRFNFDDFVHRDIAGFANAGPSADGWYIDRRCVHWEGSGRITPVEKFHRLCGTSHILACRLFELPTGLERTASREEILEAAGEFYVTHVVGSHKRTVEYFMEQGYSLKPPPFPGAIWTRGTGEHWEPSRGFPSFAGRRVTDEIRQDFHLDVPATSFLAELRAGAPQMLPAWREARRQGGWKGAIVETLWKGPLRNCLARCAARRENCGAAHRA